jgi:hypothetical protein
VNDAHLNRQHRLLYSVRGPEWAFAIPQGDLEALEDAMRRCSGFWNGAGALLIPVTKNARIPSVIDELLDTRNVDGCYIHQSLGESAQRAVRERISHAPLLYDGFDDHEVHPLHLARERDDLLGGAPAVFIPVFQSATMQRVALATWGFLPEEDLPHWRARFEVGELGGDAAYRALVQGQVGPLYTAPLLLGTTHMRLIEQRNPHEWPHLYVFDNASFGELVDFWNFRARTLTSADGAGVVGLPRQALRHPEKLASLLRWGTSPTWEQRSPDLLVSTTEKLAEEVDAALTAVGFDRDTERKLRRTWGGGPDTRTRGTYSFCPPLIGGPFDRGARDFALVAFANGTSAFSLTAPEGFQLRNGRHVRLAFRNLPLPLPVTPNAAGRVTPNAFADGGVSVLTDAVERWNFDVQLPSAWDALQDWASDHGYVVRLSQAGRYATALLERLGGLDGLGVFSDELRIRLVKLLAPESRLKLTQRLTAAVADKSDADEQELATALAERIAGVGLFLEVEARAAVDLGSDLQTKRPQVLEALAPLVEAGLVQRGQTTRCPRCNYTAFVALDDLQETLRCRACREDYLLPVADESGRREPAVTHRLDGLMARVVDQDLLPVLLALRALLPPDATRDLFFAWPGVEFEGNGSVLEVDVLTSDGENVLATEVKGNAAALEREQLDDLLAFCEAVGASPCIAALDGTFAPEFVELVAQAGGRTLDSSDLLS